MTISEAIAALDAAKPNQYSTADKIAWLSELDGKVYAEIILAHEDNPHTGFSGYSGDTDSSTALLIPEPYTDVYRHYLESMVDYYNSEITRYNNSAAMYNAAYNAYMNYYNKAHMPKTATRIIYTKPTETE